MNCICTHEMADHMYGGGDCRYCACISFSAVPKVDREVENAAPLIEIQLEEAPKADEPLAVLPTSEPEKPKMIVRPCYLCEKPIYWAENDDRIPLCLECFKHHIVH